MTAAIASGFPQTAGTGYAPGDVVYLAGGTPLPGAGAMTVTHTCVVGLSVVAAGSGGTNGSQTILGTTGTGQHFAAQAVISGGAISGTPIILYPGDYTANPTAIAAEPMTGGGLVGAVLGLTMGALYGAVKLAGAFSEAPNNPVAQLYSSGTGLGSAWNLAWNGVTPGLFRAAFPEFANTTAFPDASVNFWLGLGQSLLPHDRLTNMLDLATMLFIAHNLTVQAQASAAAANGAPPGMSRGLISSEAGPGVSVAFDTSSGIPINAGHWALTTYGTRFLQLIRNRGRGPIQIGIGATPPWVGAAWSGSQFFVPTWFNQ